MFVSGDPLRAPGPRGEVLHDASFLLWFNAHAEPGKATLPANQWVLHRRGRAQHRLRSPGRRAAPAGEVIDIEPRSLIVLRQL